MSGDTSTLSWRGIPATSLSTSVDVSTNVQPATREGTFPVKIIKVCFLSNSSNLGKNFKLVRCEEGWTVGVITLSFLIVHLLVLSLGYLNFKVKIMISMVDFVFLIKKRMLELNFYNTTILQKL